VKTLRILSVVALLLGLSVAINQISKVPMTVNTPVATL
jgi:hypothetical protein